MKIRSIASAPPKSAHPAAKKHLAEIWNAEDETHALVRSKANFVNGRLVERPDDRPSSAAA